jgi:hypothetical protein
VRECAEPSSTLCLKLLNEIGRPLSLLKKKIHFLTGQEKEHPAQAG